MNTKMGDDSALDDLSLLPDGAAIPAGEPALSPRSAPAISNAREVDAVLAALASSAEGDGDQTLLDEWPSW